MMKQKIKQQDELQKILERLKAKGKKIVFTNGCFDLLHVGHVRCLEEAKRLGDILVVGINSDRSVRQLKGPLRPILPEQERAEILSSLAAVDFVTVFDEPTPLRLIELLRPHVLVKGGDWQKNEIVGREIVEQAGGTVSTIPLVEGWSTTGIVETILKRYEKRL